MPTVVVTVTSSNNIATSESSDDWFTAANNYPYIPPVNNGETFSITLTASLEFEEEESEVGWDIDAISITGDNTIFEYSTSQPNQVTIEPTGASAFNDYFEFVMPDRSLEILTVDDAREQGFATLKQWSPPSTNVINKSHTITVEYSENLTTYTEDVTKTGNIYFKYPPFTQLVIDLVSEGSF